MGELSWQHVNNASQVLSKGDRVTAKVLDVNREKQRISLSLKQLSEDPWAGVEGEFPPDSTVEGTVTRTTDFGAFVELKPGVEGMIHISELAEKHVPSVDAVVQKGQTVQAKVLKVDPKERRIGLSIKALTAPESKPQGKPSKQDVRKYVVQQDKAHATESLGSLMDKFGGGEGGGLKGGLG